ncbi:Cell cycle serine/threonine-protein kinase cdc5/MSD2 [Vanrija albida]|uniref:Cell cycle serine/threonine-protein kinase cdc5/MSD2 n=1 Tax=Vanrija albida TaxID=181172 RepID=A0ABR3QBF5_9TREE
MGAADVPPPHAPADPAAAARPRSPPPPRKDKPVPPTPPLRILDRGRGVTYSRTGFLGEGGFARVYEVFDEEATRKAVKVVHKASIKTKKNKTKLWAEIKLHQMLVHPDVVRFHDCFEDDENVYMVLELCENGSLMDLLRRRRRYSEPEARYFLVQIIGACLYMHDMNVIHRDLKLGNLFLDGDMNVKVGDFGLAALIENPGERKKTICGTPNYIAPEVLFDTANGHSFEVDVWSVGVILYTLLIGKPPFQTKDVKAIYRRIRENRYEFPADKEISSSAMDLISSILNSNPDKRPSLQAILQHRWFTDGPFPSHIPHSANDGTPDFSNLSSSQSRRNFEAVKRKAAGPAQTTTPPPADRASQLGSSIMAQERDFNNAVQPDSPISALLNSARQPLVQAAAPIKEPSLLRKLSAAGAQSTLSPARRQAAAATLSRRPPPGPATKAPIMDDVAEEDEGQDGGDEAEQVNPVNRDRELATQKARIVSQMAAMRLSDTEETRPREVREPTREIRRDESRRERTSSSVATTSKAPLGETTAQPQRRSKEPVQVKPVKTSDPLSLYELCERNLETGMALANTEAGFSTPDIELSPAGPKKFVVSWLDYTAKYGMGVVLSDGTVSVHFNDSSSVSLSPSKQHVEYLGPPSEGRVQERRNFEVESYPSEVKTKVFLLHHFENYMLGKLLSEQPYTYVDSKLNKGMVYIERYLRMKHVILFRLSNRILQFNFYDHTKLILSENGLVVSIIDKHQTLRSWSLEALLRPASEDESAKERRRIETVVHKVQYAKDILTKIRLHGTSKTKEERKEDRHEVVEPEAPRERRVDRERERERVDRNLAERERAAPRTLRT